MRPNRHPIHHILASQTMLRAPFTPLAFIYVSQSLQVAFAVQIASFMKRNSASITAHVHYKLKTTNNSCSSSLLASVRVASQPKPRAGSDSQVSTSDRVRDFSLRHCVQNYVERHYLRTTTFTSFYGYLLSLP